MRIRSVTALAVLAIALPAGCGSSSSKSSSTTTTVSHKNVAVQTPDGQVSLSLDGKLPPNWPTSFPVPSGAKAAGSGSLANGGGSGLMVGVYTTTQAPADAFDFYKNNSSLTVSHPVSVGSGDTYVGTLELSGSYTGNVTVATVGGTAYIVVILKSGSSTTTTT